MLLLIHGDDTTHSRQYLQTQKMLLKKHGSFVKYLDGKQILKKDLEIEIKNTSLFTSTTIIVENIFSRPPSSEKQKLITFLTNLQASHLTNHLIVWESKLLSPSLLKKLSNFQVKTYKLSPSLFQFLDNFYPNNFSTVYTYLTQARQQYPDQVIFSLLVKRVYQLRLAKTNFHLLSGPTWQKQRLLKQASHWPLDKLKQLSHSLLQLDIALKTSRSPLDIKDTLDLFLLKVLT